MGIILFLAVLLSRQVNITLSYSDELKIKINYLFLSYSIFPKKEKKNKTVTKEKSPLKKKSKQVKKKFDYRIIKLLLKSILEPTRWTISHIKIDLLSIFILVAGENACETATNYGKICAAAYPIINIILENNKPKEYDIKISPNFYGSKTTIRVNLKFGITIFNLIIILTKIIIRFVSYYINAKERM